MSFSIKSTDEYKLPKLRKATFWFSTVICVLTVGGFGYIMVVFSNSEDIWQKIGYAALTIFLGFIWIGLSYTFIINNIKCTNCGISIKDDYKYCVECNLQKEKELRNTTETLCCLVCDANVESFDAFKDHYIKEHEDQPVAEGIFQPSFSKIRTTETLYIKK